MPTETNNNIQKVNAHEWASITRLVESLDENIGVKEYTEYSKSAKSYLMWKAP